MIITTGDMCVKLQGGFELHIGKTDEGVFVCLLKDKKLYADIMNRGVIKIKERNP